MAQRAILTDPDPKLRIRSAPVAALDENLERLVGDLVDTLRATKGIGLSAPQIDDRRRVVAVDLSGRTQPPEIYINPEILARSTPGFVEESCLSVPGIVGSVWRSTRVRVRALDGAGRDIERDLEGMHAVCLQHEIDHLDGKLFIDRLWWIQRYLARRKAAA